VLSNGRGVCGVAEGVFRVQEMSTSRAFTVAVLGGTGVFGERTCRLLTEYAKMNDDARHGVGEEADKLLPVRVIMVGHRPVEDGQRLANRVAADAAARVGAGLVDGQLPTANAAAASELLTFHASKYDPLAGGTSEAVGGAEHVEYASVDVRNPEALEEFVRSRGVDAVVDAVGPFQQLMKEDEHYNAPPSIKDAAEAAEEAKLHVMDSSQHASARYSRHDPFRTPRACIRGGARFTCDLADSAAYVARAPRELHEEALAAGATFVSGVSSVPALSSSALAFLQGRAGFTTGVCRGGANDRLDPHRRSVMRLPPMRALDAVDIAITPGNDAPRGESVVRAVLGYAGKPLPRWREGRWTQVPGWGDTVLSAIRPLPLQLTELPPGSNLCNPGHILASPVKQASAPLAESLVEQPSQLAKGGVWNRALSACEAPDTVLLPQTLAKLTSTSDMQGANLGDPEDGPAAGEVRRVDFRAGLELWSLHLGLQLLTQPVRWGLVDSIEPLAPALRFAAEKVRWMGSNRGGMFVRLDGWCSSTPDLSTAQELHKAQLELAKEEDPLGISKWLIPDPDRRGWVVPSRREWHLTAGAGHGPYVPVTAAVALVAAEHRRASMKSSLETDEEEDTAQVSQFRAPSSLHPWEQSVLAAGARDCGGGQIPLAEFHRVWDRHGLAIDSASFELPTYTATDLPPLRSDAASHMDAVPPSLLPSDGHEDSPPLIRFLRRFGESVGVNIGILHDAFKDLGPRPESRPGLRCAAHSAPPMFRSSMGEASWNRLDPTVRAMHSWATEAGDRVHESRGRAVAKGGTGIMARALRSMLDFPHPNATEEWEDMSVVFVRDPQSGRETWVRRFGRSDPTMAATVMKLGDRASDAGLVTEQLLLRLWGGFKIPLPVAVVLRTGSVPFADAHTSGEAMVMESDGMTVFGKRLPSWMSPKAVAREWAAPPPAGANAGTENVFWFDVSVCFPLIGEVAGYHGYLQRPRTFGHGEKIPLKLELEQEGLAFSQRS
jgi:hypothetical protein